VGRLSLTATPGDPHCLCARQRTGLVPSPLPGIDGELCAANNARLEIRVELLVEAIVLGYPDNTQVLKTVVERIAVQMMDMFGRQEWPA
jgi:hypothetical protein